MSRKKKSDVEQEIAEIVANTLADENDEHYTVYMAVAYSIIEELVLNGYSIKAEEEV